MTTAMALYESGATGAIPTTTATATRRSGARRQLIAGDRACADDAVCRRRLRRGRRLGRSSSGAVGRTAGRAVRRLRASVAGASASASRAGVRRAVVPLPRPPLRRRSADGVVAPVRPLVGSTTWVGEEHRSAGVARVRPISRRVGAQPSARRGAASGGARRGCLRCRPRPGTQAPAAAFALPAAVSPARAGDPARLGHARDLGTRPPCSLALATVSNAARADRPARRRGRARRSAATGRRRSRPAG